MQNNYLYGAPKYFLFSFVALIMTVVHPNDSTRIANYNYRSKKDH